MLGTRYEPLGTRLCLILGTRIGSLKHLKKPWSCVTALICMTTGEQDTYTKGSEDLRRLAMCAEKTASKLRLYITQ